MVTEPPVTIPVELPIEAAGLLLLHVPPGLVLLNAVVCPEQTVNVPAIAAGNGFTVTALTV